MYRLVLTIPLADQPEPFYAEREMDDVDELLSLIQRLQDRIGGIVFQVYSDNDDEHDLLVSLAREKGILLSEEYDG